MGLRWSHVAVFAMGWLLSQVWVMMWYEPPVVAKPVAVEPVTSVLVHMAYTTFHNTPRPPSHLEFFLRRAITKPPKARLRVDYILSISGECALEVCKTPEKFVRNVADVNFRVRRRANVGFDFGSHADAVNATGRKYDVYVFLNSGVTGPFVPAYMPRDWHWTEAFVDKLQGAVHIVGTSVTCIPPTVVTGPGPRVEGFAFALSAVGLQVAQRKGVFRQFEDKVSAIFGGESMLTKSLLDRRLSLDTLLLAYQGHAWTPTSSCNAYVVPTRNGGYFGAQVNPLEVMFHKTYWAPQVSAPVQEDLIKRYIDWGN